MEGTTEKVLDNALALTPYERADLAKKIVVSIKIDIDPEIESTHLDAVKSRKQQVKASTVEFIPGDEVMRQGRDIQRMINYRFHPDAQREFSETIQYYFEKDPQLANDFISANHDGQQSIRTNPEIWCVLRKNIRRYLIRRFPFGFYHTYEENFVTV